MKKDDLKKLLLFLSAAALLEAIMKSRSNTAASTSESSGSIIDSVSSGITNVVDTLTGGRVSDFVLAMTPIANQIKGIYGIEPIILISQAALESGWGKSALASKHNNLFGFTAGSWLQKGLPVVDLPTYEYIEKPIDKVTYFETPGDIVSKTSINPNETRVLVHRYFRKYPTWYDSAADWANLITGAARYAEASHAAKSGDLSSYATLVSAAGYATDPSYPSLLTATGETVQSVLV